MRNSLRLSTALAAALVVLQGLQVLQGVRADDDVCGGEEGQVCVGCNMVAVCLRLNGVDVTVAASTLCPEDKQYCANGTCVADMSPENDCGVVPTASASAASPFRCPAGHSGYLPDARDCSRYCQDGEGWDLACKVQPSTVYQHSSASCVPAWQTPCAPAVDCPPDANRTYSLYGQDNGVAFRCEQGVVDVLLCPADHRLDLEAAVEDSVQDPPCVRFCPRSGRQAVARDDTLYYECLELGDGRMGHPVLTACPDGTRFDAALERCLLVARNDF
ncbi:uncharacterized protein LOC117647329 [Thrips palmi]|uniref:Uncharacterized protein LOC117647329 n=1 Tax=Thrips palmi TaxID=161013 RepID=A0A6P8YXT2_THRPL|nr:uncharacterized protein LOC117647329 [Thrips palmi]